jgi:MraZ protein
VEVRTKKWAYVSLPSSSPLPLAFRGGPELTLDIKGRVTMPAHWRTRLNEQAGGQLVVTKSNLGCLVLYPPAVFAQVEAVVARLGAEHEDWRSFILGNACDLEIDSGSRILIPPELRRWAGMQDGGVVKFKGVGAYLQLWDLTRHDASETKTQQSEMPATLREMVLL